MKRQVYTCDCCGATKDATDVSWEQKPSRVTIVCPPDGVNGEIEFDDCCPHCRRAISAAVRSKIDARRKKQERRAANEAAF